jgi:hypothetical protein
VHVYPYECADPEYSIIFISLFLNSLGKTVQSIAMLSYLSGNKGIWGPFLIVAPNSTLHQWQQEVSKFCPQLKVLPYWGAAKERQILRQYWTSKLLYTKEAPFHVLITSYNAVVADERFFQRMKFKYLIADEAQALKNSASLRWKVLINLKCRNRVLLTGTPIQNSMNELWALLHWCNPELFESREDFSDWFGKEVEDAATEGVRLDQRQLHRLHMILKPFMLRRVKCDVENEMPPKIEVLLPCKLSATQRRIYKLLQQKIVFAHALDTATSQQKKGFLSTLSGPQTFAPADPRASDSLVTLVMQFRKLCNHPELYERKVVPSPFYFGKKLVYPMTKQKAGGNANAIISAGDAMKESVIGIGLSASASALTKKPGAPPILFIPCPAASLNANPIAPRLPSIIHNAIHIPARTKLLDHSFSLFTAMHIHSALHHTSAGKDGVARSSSSFAALSLLNMSAAEMSFLAGAEPLHAWFVIIVLLHRRDRAVLVDEECSRHRYHMDVTPMNRLASLPALNLGVHVIAPSSKYALPAFPSSLCLEGDGLIWRDPAAFSSCVSFLRRVRRLSRARAVAPPAYPLWSRTLSSPSAHGGIDVLAPEYVGWEKSVLLGIDCWKWANFSQTRNMHGCTYPVSLQLTLDLLPIGLNALHKRTYVASPFTQQQFDAKLVAEARISSIDATFQPMLHSATAPLSVVARTLHASSVVGSYSVPGLITCLTPLGISPASRLLVPTVEDLISDSGKLQVLDRLLRRLKLEGHRVLIFSQMTKLIDLLENFLRYRRYKYARLDGQTALSARRDLVKTFQTDQSVFAFLLSTRAGGLGINCLYTLRYTTMVHCLVLCTHSADCGCSDVCIVCLYDLVTSADTVIFYDNDWNPSCLEVGTLVQRSDGTRVKVEDVCVNDWLCGQDGVSVQVKDKSIGISDEAYCLTTVNSSHVVTAEHKVTLRWCSNPVTSSTAPPRGNGNTFAQNPYHLFTIVWFDRATVTPSRKSWHWLPFGEQKELQFYPRIDDSEVVLGPSTHQEMHEYALKWLALEEEAGRIVRLQLGELFEMSARDLYKHAAVLLGSATNCPVRLPLVPPIAQLERPLSVESMQQPVSQHVSTAIELGAFVISQRYIGEGAYVPVKVGAHCSILYMVHNPMQVNFHPSYTIHQLEEAWRILRLEPTADDGIIISELNPIASEGHQMKAWKVRCDESCRLSICTALNTNAQIIVAFETGMSPCWKNIMDLQLPGVLSIQHVSPTHSIIMLQHRSVHVFHAYHPSCWSQFDSIVRVIAEAHSMLNGRNLLETEKRSEAVSAGVTQWVSTSLQSIAPAGRSIHWVGLKVSHNGRFALADRVLTHNCLVGPTLVSTGNGFSLPIVSVTKGTRVLAYDADQKGHIITQTSAHLTQGNRSCIELMFSDGRTVICTPEHRFLTTEGQWMEAQQMVIESTEITAGMEYPTLQQPSAVDPWELRLPSMGYSLDAKDHLQHSIAFAGLIGYVLTDATITPTLSRLNIGHVVDVEWVQRDIQLLTGQLACTYFDRNLAVIQLPDSLHRAFLHVGVSTTDRLTDVGGFPPFLLDAHCPIALIQAFLSGLFGGNGKTLSLSWRARKPASIVEIRWSCIRNGSVMGQAVQILSEQLNALFIRVGIVDALRFVGGNNPMTPVTEARGAEIARRKGAGESLSERRCGDSDPAERYSLVWCIEMAHTLDFSERIGFRYASHKQMQLTAGVTYSRLRSTLQRQKEFLDKYIRKLGDMMPLRYVLGKAKQALALQECVHPAILEYSPVRWNRKELYQDAQRIGMSIDEALGSFDALKFFSDQRQKKQYSAASEKFLDGVSADAMALPTFRVRLVAKRFIHGTLPVYDISVPWNQSFIAQGLTSHNCVSQHHMH